MGGGNLNFILKSFRKFLDKKENVGFFWKRKYMYKGIGFERGEWV